MAEKYFELRKHKGVTEEVARDTMLDVSYFGTMMVYQGLADAMVSGAAHTTGHTIRPALEFIRTRPGCSIVSSVFFMCLPTRVLVYGDCAIVPNPTPPQLADIAISSAETAMMMGIEPRVAMLSYSTGRIGQRRRRRSRSRGDTRSPRRLRPDLMIDGPLQYDAAVDPGVGKRKMPDQRRRGSSDGLHLSRPEHRQQHVQGGPALVRRRRGWSGAAGLEQTRQRPESRMHRRRHRQHRRHHRHSSQRRAGRR